MDKVYNMKSLYMGNVPNNDPSRVQDGTLTMTIEILAATGLVFGEPETDPGVTKTLRVDAAWTIHKCPEKFCLNELEYPDAYVLAQF